MGGHQALTASCSAMSPAGNEPSSAVQALLEEHLRMPCLAASRRCSRKAPAGSALGGHRPAFILSSGPLQSPTPQLTQRVPGDPSITQLESGCPGARRLQPQKQEVFRLSLLGVGTELKQGANTSVGKRSSQVVPGAHPCQPGQGSGPAASRERAREEEDERTAGPPAEEGSVGLKMAPLPLLGSGGCWAQRESRGALPASFHA